MAGIGFELKKLFARKGVLATLRAYGYAGIVCTGPMLLGVALLICVRMIASWGGASHLEQDLLVAMFTYVLLASLTVTSIISMITTRFIADTMYMDKLEWILPSYYGSTCILLVFGTISFGTFLLFSGVEIVYQILCLVFFCELVVVWTQINYITAVKDYRKILLMFFAGIVSAVLCGVVFVLLKMEIVSALLLAACIGYGIMMAGYTVVLHKYFPRGQGSAFRFLEWFDRYPSLTLVGFFITVGLFSHLVITWFGPIGVRVQGLFYGAPQYDIPALMAFLSVLYTTINFTTSVEVNFYPRYKQYFALLNYGGSIKHVDIAEKEMLTVLRHELNYLAQKQLVMAVLFIILGGPLLLSLNLGFTEKMIGTFRTLCIGYGMYAIANSIMLSLLYFADNAGALWTSFVFMAASVSGTIFLLNGNQSFYGFGFLIGAGIMYLFAWLRLVFFTKKIQYHVLCTQPVLMEMKKGVLTALSEKLVARADKKKQSREVFSDESESAVM